MAVLQFRPKAKKDLEKIWLYSYKNWGIIQADQYLDEMELTCCELANSSKKGQSVGYIRKGYYRYHIQKHYIYFRKTKEGIEVIRLLHERMKPEKHL